MKTFYPFLILLIGSNYLFAQTWSVDNTFQIGSGFNDVVLKTQTQTDGKIIVVGSFTSYNDTIKNYIVRLNSDGSIDQSFQGTGTDDDIYSVEIQNDGKILIGGNFTTYNGVFSKGLARILPNGNFDDSFNVGGGANFTVFATAIQEDQKILVGGNFSNFNFGSNTRILTRLHSNGELDTTFCYNNLGFNNPSVNNYVSTIAIQNDHKILIGGLFSQYNSSLIEGVLRLNENGLVDTTFEVGQGLNLDGSIANIILQTEQKIVLVGYFSTINGINRDNFVRLYPDGAIDSTINNNTVFGPSVAVLNGICQQADGSLLFGGNFNSYGSNLANNLLCLTNVGESCSNFDVGLGPNGHILNCTVQPDGKIILSGYFTSFDGQNKNHITRLNPYNLSVPKIGQSFFKIFPNPTYDNLEVTWNDDLTNISYQLRDISGKLIVEKKQVFDQQFQLNLTQEESGIYFLELFLGTEKVDVLKIIKD